MYESTRPHGPRFDSFTLVIEAVTTSDEEIERIADLLDEVDVEASLVAVARRIEERIPEVRVEIER